jgi:hypothetical protein
MFPCACSLRSTQCAALIALAAAAGIMRIEPPRSERGTASAQNREQAQVQLVDQPTGLMNRFHIDGGTIAPWVRLVHVAWQQLAERAPPTAALSPPIEKPLRARFTDPVPVPSARQHSFPYAVGPPLWRTTLTPRAGDTEVSGDSIARRGLFSRVAIDLVLSRFARPTRTGSPSLKLAGTFSNPSSVLRGEPKISLCFSAHSSRCICVVAAATASRAGISLRT